MSIKPPESTKAALTPHLAVYVLVLILTFGYEAFSFNLTIDEEVVGNTTNSAVTSSAWLQQGRWMMSLVSLVLPNTTVPALPIGIGVMLMGVAFWKLFSLLPTIRPWVRVVVASFASTYPSLAMTFSFSTFAIGIGLGFLGSYLFLKHLSKGGGLNYLLALAFGSCAIGLYDTFIAVIFIFALALGVMRANWKHLLTVTAIASGAVISSKLLSLAFQYLFNFRDSGYTDNHYDFAGILTDFRGRRLEAIYQVQGLFDLSSDRFGLTSEWLSVSVKIGLLVVLMFLVLVKMKWNRRVLRFLALFFATSIPLVAEIASPWPVPSRSLVYIPVYLFFLGYGVFYILEKYLKVRLNTAVVLIFSTVFSFAALSQATIANRLFSNVEISLDNDRDLAREIAAKRDELFPDSEYVAIPTVIIGRHAWAPSSITPTRETLGGSFFDLNEDRALKFLNYAGVLSSSPESDFRKTHLRLIRSQKSYPKIGWVQKIDNVLVVKLSDE